ncbi:hypothetical protein WMY93_019050 [Mugilogobius chulae]|uniref:LIM zinc-binding domain-containing protein n=1 Tax=Mugilogobius chulae TaxID=88201 RepID=A0AAW0NMY3_9GOBI
MTSPRALDDLLDDRHRGDQTGGGALVVREEQKKSESGPAAGANHVRRLRGAGLERFFLLAAGRAWHSWCLCCSVCQCELQGQTSLFWRDGAPYCHQHYIRLFSGGQCARCLQSIPASDLVMKSGDLTFHQHCFCCQECEVQLLPGSLYCLQGHSLFCQPHCASSVEPGVQSSLHCTRAFTRT